MVRCTDCHGRGQGFWTQCCQNLNFWIFKFLSGSAGLSPASAWLAGVLYHVYTHSTCILPCLVWFRVYIHSITALLYGNIAHLVVLPVTNQMVIGSNPAMGMCGSWKGDVPEVNMYSELVIQETSGLGPLVTLKYHIHHSNNKIPSRNNKKKQKKTKKNLPPSNPTGQKGVFISFCNQGKHMD